MLRTFALRATIRRPHFQTLRFYNISAQDQAKIKAWTPNKKVQSWIEEQAKILEPKDIHLCDGSQKEFQTLTSQLESQGVITRLNPAKRPNSFAARSDPNDVARVESRTYICTKTKDEAGPTNNWMAPDQMRETMKPLLSGSMKGRTMYVMPYSMGPLGSPISHIGVQVTDSSYVVANMGIMTRMGKGALDVLGSDKDFVRCTHTLGAPLKEGQKDVNWPCNPTKYIVHYPEERSIVSYGSGYGGNALLGKKCFSLRIASAMAKEGGWLAEHMLILGLTNPQGVKKYVAAAFPSACGKTNLAMMTPTLPGWKVETVGDDIAWMKFGKDGRLYAINPENGFFGVAPGTSMKSNPNAMKTITSNTLFTNVALTADGDVYWEGIGDKPKGTIIDWKGNSIPEGQQPKEPLAHANSRFTVPIAQCPSVDPKWNNPEGVPIDAIIFGGRRSSTVPLVYQAFDWEHGVFMGASVASEQTAAAEGPRGQLRHDPFAMLPFCGYNMGDYLTHWLNVGSKADANKLPKMFFVNWFRKGKDGSFLWPGFGENSRVLKWIVERCDTKGEEGAIKTPVGFIPKEGGIDTTGLQGVSAETMKELFAIKPADWMNDVSSLRSYFEIFGSRLPSGIKKQLDSLEARLKSA